MNIIKDQVIIETAERANELLHMILDLRLCKDDVDLHKMQTLVLEMYTDNIRLNCEVTKLKNELDNRKRKIIEIPTFVAKKGEAH